MGLIEKLFGTRSQRELKKIQPTVDKILALEDSYKNLSEEELRGKTAEFKQRLDKGRPWTICSLKPSRPSGRLPTGCWVCGPIRCSSSAASFCIRAGLPR